MNQPLFRGQSAIHTLIAEQQKAQSGQLLAASLCAAAVSVAAVVLLGLSAWFLTASAVAGLAGPMVARAFNYMIPSAMIRLLAIVRTAARYGERITGHNAALKALAALRPELFAAIARSDNGRALSSGEASARLMQDVDAVQNRFVRLSTPWGAGAAIFAGIATCAFSGWPVALGVTVIGGLYIALSVVLAKRVTKAASEDLRVTAGQLKESIGSMTAAAPELRAYGMTEWACAKVTDAAAPYIEARQDLSIGTSWLMVAQTFAMALSVIVVVLTTAGGSAALMALALLSAIAVLDACGTFVTAIGQRGEVAIAIARLDALMSPSHSGYDEDLIQPSIDVQGLYTLKTRSLIGISGKSGSGKTTLVEQLMKLRDIPKGVIRLGGKDLSDLTPKQARALFAYAPQQAQFINASVAENLRLASPNATDDELWYALKQACLSDRIKASPLGLGMAVGENGMALSGGERRRLGLARAYLRHAPFLVLDEPTEGLDAATERVLIERLRQHLAMTGQGLILISHRPYPLAICQELAAANGVGADGVVDISMMPAHTTPRSSSYAV